MKEMILESYTVRDQEFIEAIDIIKTTAILTDAPFGESYYDGMYFDINTANDPEVLDDRNMISYSIDFINKFALEIEFVFDKTNDKLANYTIFETQQNRDRYERMRIKHMLDFKNLMEFVEYLIQNYLSKE